jgi:hypothetical protein
VRWITSPSTECRATSGRTITGEIRVENSGAPDDPNRSYIYETISGVVNNSDCKEICLNAGVLCTGYQTNKGNTECVLWKIPVPPQSPIWDNKNEDYDCTRKMYPELEYGQTAENTDYICYISTGADTGTQRLNICSSATYYNRPVTLTNGQIYISASYNNSYVVQAQSQEATFSGSWYILPVDNLSGVFYIQNALSGFRIWGDVRTDLTSGSFKSTSVGYPGSQNVVEMFTMKQNSDTNGTKTFIPYLSCTGCSQYANMVLSMVNLPKINLATVDSYPSYTVGSLPKMTSTVMQFRGNANVSGNWLNYPGQVIDMSKGFSFVTNFCFTSSANWQRLFDFGNGPANKNILFTQNDSSSTFRFGIYNGLVEYKCDGGTITYNTYQKVVGVYDPSMATMRTYINGVKVAEVFLETGALMDTRTLANCYIGRSNWSGDNYTNMNVEYLKVYNRVLSADEIQNAVPGIGLKQESETVISGLSQNVSSWNINSLSYPTYGFAWMSSNMFTYKYNGLPSTTIETFSNSGGGDTIQFNQMMNNGVSMSNNCLILQPNKLYHIICGVQASLPDYAIFGFTVETRDQLNNKNMTIGMPGSSLYLNKPLNTRSETSKNVTSFIYDTKDKAGTDLRLRMSCTNKDNTGSLAGLPNFVGPLQAGDIMVPMSTSYMMVNELSPFYQSAQVTLTDDQTITVVNTMIKMNKVMFNNDLLVTSYLPYITLSNNCVYLIQCSLQGNVDNGATIRIKTKSGTAINSNWVYLRNPQNQNVTNTGTLTCIYNTFGLSGDDLLIGLYVTDGTVKISKYSEMTITQFDNRAVYQIFSPSSSTINNAKIVAFGGKIGSGNGGLNAKIVNNQIYTQLQKNKIYKIICTVGSNSITSRVLFQLKTLSGNLIGTQLILSNVDSESGLETLTAVYSTWGKTDNDVLIGLVSTIISGSTMQISMSRCQLICIEMANNIPDLSEPPYTLPPLIPSSVVNGVDVTKDLYLLSYLNYNKLNYNATGGNLNVSISNEMKPPMTTRFKFVPILGTTDEYNLIIVSTGSRVYIEKLTGTINVFGDNSPASEDVIDRFKLTSVTKGNLTFVSIRTSMSVCTADFCLNNTDEYFLVNSNNTATFKQSVSDFSHLWYLRSVPTSVIFSMCDLYGISICKPEGVVLSAIVDGQNFGISELNLQSALGASVIFAERNNTNEQVFYFEEDYYGSEWFNIYTKNVGFFATQKTRVYLRYDALYNHLKVSNNDYLNQLYYFRVVPYGKMDGTFGIEARAGRDCAFYCSNKYLRRWDGIDLNGIIDGTEDIDEMLLFRIL